MDPIEPLLRAQAGVVSRRQALDAGMAERTIRRRLASGAWVSRHPQVYLAAGHRWSDEARVRAALLWADGTPATVTGAAAAYWHRMIDRPPALIEVTLPRAARRPGPDGVQVRGRDLAPSDRTRIRGVDVARAPLAALEATVVEGSHVLDRALQKHTSLAEVQRCYRRNLGLHGWAEVRRLLVAAADGGESAAERLLVRQLRVERVTGWELGLSFGPYTIDLAFPAARLAVEVDGWAWHSDPVRFRADRRKGNALTGAGWQLLRFTWHDLDRDAAAVVAEICRCLIHGSSGRSARSGTDP